MVTQSPMIALPAKETGEVDLVKPLAQSIVKSYEQSPAPHMNELHMIAKARQDATGQASTETTARDLLFRYFHIVEMLELRFPELDVPFVWHDAFSRARVDQAALAYEKACILFNTASRLSHIAMQLNRADTSTDALKRAYAGFRQAAGLLQYVKDSFLYAPSDDMKGPALESLCRLMLTQAAEIFLEKSVHDGKSDALVSKLASYVAHAYAALMNEWKNDETTVRIPYMWIQIVECKASVFASTAQLHRARADRAGGKHADALARFRFAEVKARTAANQASLDTWSSATHLRGTVPTDVAQALAQLVNSQLANATEARREAERDNDLVYHERAPDMDALPPIEQTSVTTATPIRDVFSQPDVQKVLGGDVLTTLVPLSVLENTSVYTEEQAKLVRAESAQIDAANDRIPEAMSALALPDALERYAALDGHPVPPCVPSAQVLDMCDELTGSRVVERIDHALEALRRRAPLIEAKLSDAMADLDTDARECERARVTDPATTQAPTASVARSLRRDIQAARDALATARTNDDGVAKLWRSVRDDVALLANGRDALNRVYTERASVPACEDLIDTTDVSDPEPARVLWRDTHAQMRALLRMPHERQSMLDELKRRVRSDDISRTLLLHRRVQNMERSLFAQELAKYAPLQKQIRDHISLQAQRVAALHDALDRLRTHPGAADVRRRWDASQAGAKEWNQRLAKAHEAFADVQSAISQAELFYTDMSHSAGQLAANAERMIAGRRAERASLAMASDPIPSAAPKAGTTTLSEDLAALRMSYPPPPPPPSAPEKPAPPPRPPRI